MGDGIPGSEPPRATPVAASQRIAELDVLRGVALFGVFLVNMLTIAGAGMMATQSQLDALATSDADRAVRAAVRWLAYDKANTLFAFLFGLGFCLQMQRVEARGGDFERIYLRRLAVLLGIGLVHFLLVFSLDVLLPYAICGFILLAMRRVDDRVLLVGGVILAVFGRLVFEVPANLSGADNAPAFHDAAVMQRQALSQTGDYVGLAQHFGAQSWSGQILGGGLVALVLYALGRFMVGAWVARRGWLQNASAHAAGFRTWMWRLLPAGLAGEALGQLLGAAPRLGVLPPGAALEAVSATVHMLATPVLAAGYLCAIVAFFQTRVGRVLLAPFADVGRMALTNYITQSFIIAFVLFGVGPGLALAGSAGATVLSLVVAVGFALQVIATRLWLSRFAYGPLEWVWRALTYGQAPRLRLQPAAGRSKPPLRPALPD